MLNIELAVLQSLDHNDWCTTGKISARSKIQEQATALALSQLNQSGIIEYRTNLSGNSTGSEIIEWRSQDHSLETYLKDIVPA